MIDLKKKKDLLNVALNSAMPYFIAEFLVCDKSFARHLITASYQVAINKDLLCQFRYNCDEISFRYFPCADKIRFSIIEKARQISIYCDINGEVSIESINLKKGGKK